MVIYKCRKVVIICDASQHCEGFPLTHNSCEELERSYEFWEVYIYLQWCRTGPLPKFCSAEAHYKQPGNEDSGPTIVTLLRWALNGWQAKANWKSICIFSLFHKIVCQSSLYLPNVYQMKPNLFLSLSERASVLEKIERKINQRNERGVTGSLNNKKRTHCPIWTKASPLIIPVLSVMS